MNQTSSFFKSTDHDGFRYTLVKVAGHVHAWRQQINVISFDGRDHGETISPKDLPASLREAFYTLASGDLPAVA